MKKILSFFFTLTLIFSICSFNASAKSNLINTNKNQYISLDDAKLLVNYTVQSRISKDNNCPWKDGVSIGDIIPMYDFDDVPNSYAFNLKQNNKNLGHILVDANINSPGVVKFSYDTNFDLDKVFNKNFKNSNNLDKKYYFISAYSILVKGTDSNKKVFYNIFSKEKISDDNSTIKSNYNKIKQNAKNQNLINIFNKVKSSSLYNCNLDSINKENLIQSSPSIIEKSDVPNCENATFYTTDQFYADNNCGPTAGTTLIMYWYNQRGVSDLVFPAYRDTPTVLVYNQLLDDMHCNQEGSGTTTQNFYDGMLEYGRFVNCPAKGSDIISRVTFQSIRNNIANGNPVAILIHDQNKYGDHFVDVFGIERNTDDSYLRIADGWTNSHQTWYSYSYLNPAWMIYARWN